MNASPPAAAPTGPRRPPARVLAASGAAFFLCFFALYVAGHAASIYLDDSGETVTAAAALGVAHPPGYPLHTLIARLATRLPLGGPAEPVTLLAALFGALAAAALFVGLLGLGPAAGPAGFAACALPAALLGLGPVFWHNALTAKGGIYQLNNLLSVLLLGLLAAPGEPSRRRLRAFWALFGLSVAHHYMSQLPLLPAYAWLLWRRARGRGPLADAWLAVPGVALYLYIPLRAARQPDLNWGHVRDPEGFLFFLFRMQYAAKDISRSVATSLAQARYALGLFWSEGAYALLPAAAAGLWIGRREARTQAYALGWLASLASVTFYMNLTADRLVLIRPYLFPGYLCQALLAARAFTAAAAGVRSAAAGRALAAAALAACLALAAASAPGLDLSDYYFAVDNARGLLATLPRNALLLCQGDAVVFPLWYAQRVLHRRDDVAVVGLAVLPMDWLREDLSRHWPDLNEPKVRRAVGAESVPGLTDAVLALNPQRPPYAAFDKFDPRVTTWKLESRGPDFLCVPTAFGRPDAVLESAGERRAALLRLEAVPIRGFTRARLDADTRKYMLGDLAVRYNVLGLAAEGAGSYAEALADYQRAHELAPDDPNYCFNMGNAYYGLGQKAEAAQAFDRSVALDPGYVNGWFNGGVTLIQIGRIGDARARLERAHRLSPDRSDVAAALREIGGI